MNERVYIVKRQNKENLILKESEIIENALQQKSEGIEPHYSFYDYKKREAVTPAGWLIWSTYDSCGICYRRTDGKLIIVTGRQGDFCYM